MPVLLMTRLPLALTCALLALPMQAAASGQPPSTPDVIDPNGTARLSRVIPVPSTLSPEAQAWLAKHVDAGKPLSVDQNRANADAWEAKLAVLMQAQYPTRLHLDTVAGVPVKIITPPSIPASHRSWVLINIHGGSFQADWGSSAETIPIASLTQAEVLAVLYPLSPDHPYPAAVNAVVAVYRETLKTHSPAQIVLYGTSAGAVLTAEVAVRLKQLGLPEPAALGIFSGFGDFSRDTDSHALFTVFGFSPAAPRPDDHSRYVGATNPRDPVLSPLFADLSGLPPTLFVSSTRDLLLSGTTILHRAYLRAGVDARLVVFEALPHAFWNEWFLPESAEAHHLMARFFTDHLQPSP